MDAGYISPSGVIAHVRAGRSDENAFVQAFARHRLAALEEAAKVDRETIIGFIKLAYVTGFNDGWADGNGEGDAVNTACRGDGLGDFMSGVSSNDAIRALSNKTGEGSGAGDPLAAHVKDFRWRANQCRTNADAYSPEAATIWDLAADALEGRK
jgi:hypothetical protein